VSAESNTAHKTAKYRYILDFLVILSLDIHYLAGRLIAAASIHAPCSDQQGEPTTRAGGVMDGMVWIAQIVLAGVFLYAGFSTIFASGQRAKAMKALPNCTGFELTHGWAIAIAVIEIAGALCMLVPVDLWLSNAALLLVASVLALLMLAASIYHALRREPPAPSMAIFLVALFVIVGRWP
jgi:uncharacterized membrane protein YphA (DoxX/SURF4 family)